jgi:uncharacterized protein YggE
MKHLVQLAVIVGGIVAGSLLLSGLRLEQPVAQAGPKPQPTAETACDNSRTVQVSGAATINVVPDRVLIELGVQSNGVTPTAVQAANSEAMQAVMAALAAQGIEAKDIATDIYVIEPIYEDYDSLDIKGYRINNTIAITLREVQQTSPVLAAALEAGANQVVNVEFYTSELRKYRDQARDLAMKAATEKAEALATSAGAGVGCVLNISENSWSAYHGWYGRNQNLWTQNVVQNVTPIDGASNDTGDEPISLGQIAGKAEVGVTFGLK